MSTDQFGVLIMPKIFTHLTFILLTLTALTGMWMRWTPFFPISFLPYDHILHAHSHLAILGWAFLGTVLLFLAFNWNKINNKKEAIVLVITIFITTFLMFIAFLYEGYQMYSIIMSTAHIFVEYWTILFIIRQLKQMQFDNKLSLLFMKGGLVTLFISTIGPFSLGFLGASGLKESSLFDMAIYFYLHFQYNGWLFLFLTGLFLYLLEKRFIKLNKQLLITAFWIYIIALGPWYLSSILWANLGVLANTIAMIGGIGQWISVTLLLLAFISIIPTVSTSRATILTLLFTFSLLLIKSTMELGLISPELATLVFETRNVIIGYLHLTLLGFISIFILTQMQLVKLIHSGKKSYKYGMFLFLTGFLLNEGLLFSSGIYSWLGIGTIPFINLGLLIASILLLIGILFIWSATFPRFVYIRM